MEGDRLSEGRRVRRQLGGALLQACGEFTFKDGAFLSGTPLGGCKVRG